MNDYLKDKIEIDITKSQAFSTPLVIYDWPDSESLNNELMELILKKESEDDRGYGVRSNAGGWQSPDNLILWPEPCIQALKKRMEKLVFSLVESILRPDGTERSFTLLIDSWANINRQGNYNVVHTHPNCMWSGVYYVSSGEPDKSVPYSGLLEMLDPRESANYIQLRNTVLDARTFVENKPGRMVLFPSWLKHMVHPFVGEGTRVSIAFNTNVVENEVS